MRTSSLPPGLPTGTFLLAVVLVLGLLLGVLLILGRRARRKARPAADPSRTLRIPPAAAAPDRTRVDPGLAAGLVLESGPDKGRTYPLQRMKILIGRPGGRLNDIEITDATVSKEQAALLYDDAGKEFTLVNESATNPTLVDGAEIAGPTVLKPGALIGMGKTALRFKSERAGESVR